MTVFQQTQRGETWQGYTDLEVMCCPVCGVMYAVPERLLDHARKHPDQWWYCANGHHLHFPGKSDEQKIKDLRDRLAAERASHDQTNARLIAQRGATTRIRNEKKKVVERVANGVCPCCQRTFKQLAQHMKRQHPEFVDEHTTD